MRNAGTLEFGNNCVPLAVRCTLRIGEQWESLADAQKFCSGKTCQIMRNAGTLEIIVYLCTTMQIVNSGSFSIFQGHSLKNSTEQLAEMFTCDRKFPAKIDATQI